MTVLLDLSGITPNYVQSVDLDGATFTLTFHYRGRDDSWTVDIDDANNAAIIHGVKLVVGEPLLNGCVSLNRPAGELIVIDSSNADRDPGLADLQGNQPRVYIGYIS